MYVGIINYNVIKEEQKELTATQLNSVKANWEAIIEQCYFNVRIR